MIKKQTILWLILLAVGASFVFISVFTDKGDEFDYTNVTPSPTLTPSPSATVVVPKKTPVVNQKIASCDVGGEIYFLESNLFEDRGSFINYKNIDSISRLIDWKISPDAQASIGPNMFSGLVVPDGSSSVLISFNEKPSHRNFVLTASVSYGVLINGEMVVKTAQCSGQVKVTIGY